MCRSRRVQRPGFRWRKWLILLSNIKVEQKGKQRSNPSMYLVCLTSVQGYAMVVCGSTICFAWLIYKGPCCGDANKQSACTQVFEEIGTYFVQMQTLSFWLLYKRTKQTQQREEVRAQLPRASNVETFPIPHHSTSQQQSTAFPDGQHAAKEYRDGFPMGGENHKNYRERDSKLCKVSTMWQETLLSKGNFAEIWYSHNTFQSQSWLIKNDKLL